MKGEKFWNFRNEKGKAELSLYGTISSSTWWGDEVTPKDFKKDLDALGEVQDLSVYINSDGGDVFAGQAIHSMLKRHPAHVTVYVDGLAASIASVVAMAGDTIVMPRNSMLMIHNPWTMAVGNAQDFRKMADDLDSIQESIVAAYQEKSGMDRDELISLLDQETWLTAEEAVAYKLVDQIESEKVIAASARSSTLLVMNGQEMDLSKYRHPPKLIETTPKAKTHDQPSRLVSLYEKRLRINENRRF